MNRYHVDSSVVLADMFEEVRPDILPKLWQLSGQKKKFTVIFTTIVLGEILKVIKEGPRERMEPAFDYLKHLFGWYTIGIYTPESRVFTIINDLKEIDYRLEPMDLLILASAIAHKASKFLTFDSDFLHAETLRGTVRKRYNLIIQQPSESV